MRSQSSILTHTTKSLSSLTQPTNQHRSPTPVGYQSTLPAATQTTLYPRQMTTGSGISGSNANSGTAHQKPTTSPLSLCNTIASTSSINTLSKASTISSTIRHINSDLSMNNNNNTTTISNITAISTSNINNLSNNNNNNDEGNNNNQNPNWSKLQTLEQRKLELEKLLNEKNWLLQQIHKQEAQILNGNCENINLFDAGAGGSIVTGGITGSNITNSILRRKGSSSLKLNKTNVHFNGKNNRFTLSKSEYDLAQENKVNNQPTTTNQNITTLKKRQGPPQKTNSFHDSTSASALSLTKSPSFEYNGSTINGGVVVGGGGNGSNGSHSIKYSVLCSHHGSSENLTNNFGVIQCDKYYLSPTSQMYADGSGLIKASQNIKQCLSPSPLHKIITFNDTEAHRTKQQQQQQQQLHLANNVVPQTETQQHLEKYESVDALSLSPSTNFAFEQGQHVNINQHSNLWRTISNNDRYAWCDSTSYVELDSDSGNPYHNLKPLTKKVISTSLSGSSLHQSPESPLLGNFYPVSGVVVSSLPNSIEKACDEISISSVNSETNKKPKNKQWIESSLDGPVIRPNSLQTTTQVADTIALCPALSPTLSQNPQYTYYNVARQATSSSAALSSGKLTPSSALAAGGSSLLVVPVVSSRPPTRTLTHHSHPHHKQSYRERTKLSSQSMSSGSYRAPKTKLDEDYSHLSHSTSYLNFEPYNHHHFHLYQSQQQQQLQQQQQQSYHYNHYHMEIPNSSSSLTLSHLQQLQQQKSTKATSSSTLQQPSLPKFSPTLQQHQSPSSINCDDFVGEIRYATSVATQPSRLCNPTQATNTINTIQKSTPPNSISINSVQQLSPQATTTSPDIRIESPKNMTVVQQAKFLPYKEVTKPFEMSDFYKYSTKFRQKEANIATMTKNTT